MSRQLEILKYPDPRLKKVSTPVTQFDSELHQLLDNMAFTMYRANGIGLAAAQVDVAKRVFIIDLGLHEGSPKQLLEFINPKLHDGEGKIVFEEGCLSVPGITEEVTRKKIITVDYQDRFGTEKQLQTEALLAVAIQHENDHLDGIVFVERLSALKRRLIRRKIEKRVTL